DRSRLGVRGARAREGELDAVDQCRCSVQRAPSQYRCAPEPPGSGYQPGGAMACPCSFHTGYPPTTAAPGERSLTTSDAISAGRKQKKPKSHHRKNGRPFRCAITAGMNDNPTTTTIQTIAKAAEMPSLCVVYV